MQDVSVVSTTRTPVGKRQGYLRGYTAPDLLAAVLNEAVDKIDLPPERVEDGVAGTVY